VSEGNPLTYSVRVAMWAIGVGW